MAGAPPEPALHDAATRQLLEGVRQFNEGCFFECHDTLEELWGGIRGPSRDFFQGLIQVSVAFYHLTGGNLAGAESMFGRALKRFEAYPATYCGFDLAAQRREIEDRLRQIRSGAPEATAEPPRWRFDLDEALLRAAEERVFVAIGAKDVAALQVELAGDFVHSTLGSPDQDRAAFLQAIREMPYRILEIGGEQLRVRVLGDVALVSGFQRARVALPSGDVVAAVSAFVDVFARTGEAWRLRHAFSVEMSQSSEG